MHLGIDFGTSFTKIGYIINNTFINLAGEEKQIPSLAAYVQTNEKIIYGKDVFNFPEAQLIFFFKLNLKHNINFSIGPFKLTDILYGFFDYLNHEYIVSSQIKFNSAAVSVPNYFGLKARQLLIKNITESLNIAKVFLVPEPLAALIGYNQIDNPDNPLRGEILSIDIGGGTTDFSFLNTSATGKHIMMETQLQLGHDAFSGSEIDKSIVHNIFIPALHMKSGQYLPPQIFHDKKLSNQDIKYKEELMRLAEQLKIKLSTEKSVTIKIPYYYEPFNHSLAINTELFIQQLQPVFKRFQTNFAEIVRPQAELLGIYENNAWNLDYLFLLGGASYTRGIKDLITQIFTDIPVASPLDYQSCVVKGLAFWDGNNSNDILTSIKCIYPFNFFIETRDVNQGYVLTRIPFDTTNLELDIHGRYKLFSLPVKSNYNLSSADNMLKLRIYEVAEVDYEQNIEGIFYRDLVLNYQANIPPEVEYCSIYFDLASATLSCDLSESLPHSETKETHLLYTSYENRQKQAALLAPLISRNEYLCRKFTENVRQQNKLGQNCGEIALQKLLLMLQIWSSK